MRKVSVWIVVAVSALAAAALALAPTGMAKDGDVLVRGSCTGGTSSKLKLSEENGGIEVEFEVDQNRNGVRWRVAIFRNGTRVARLTRVTRGPSGSFEARIVTGNRAGNDAFRARAVSPRGDVCAARATWTA